MIVEVPNCQWWVEIDEMLYPFCPCNVYIDEYLIDEVAFDFDTGKFDCVEESSIKNHEGYESKIKLLEKEVMRVWQKDH